MPVKSGSMSNAKKEFARRLKAAMLAAGHEPRPVVLEREFNRRYAGEPMTPHGVRRWLSGEVLPPAGKLEVLAGWLNTTVPALTGMAASAVREDRPAWATASESDHEVIEAFLRLRAQQKRVAREVILALAKAGKG